MGRAGGVGWSCSRSTGGSGSHLNQEVRQPQSNGDLEGRALEETWSVAQASRTILDEGEVSTGERNQTPVLATDCVVHGKNPSQRWKRPTC